MPKSAFLLYLLGNPASRGPLLQQVSHLMFPTQCYCQGQTAHCANSTNRFGRCFKLDRPVQEYHVFYIGHEGQTLTNLMISYNKSQVSLASGEHLVNTGVI